MKLLSSWHNRIQDVQLEPVGNRIKYSLKKSPRYYAIKTNFIDTLDGAETMLDFAMQRPLSHIGFDTEFKYDRPGVVINKNNTANDPRSIRPLLLSLAMVEPFGGDSGRMYNFVIDLRQPELLPSLDKIFRLPVTFSAHFGKGELFCLWQLGLPEPTIFWDTFIFEKALTLGQHHHRYNLSKTADDFDQIKAKEESKEKNLFDCSLVSTCQRYGVAHGMVTEKERLQKSFLTHSDGKRFSKEQIDYAAEDAVVACKLYPLQVHKALQQDLLHHCGTVEMAWVITNARIEWNGVRIDEKKREGIISRLKLHQQRLENYLASEYGIRNTKSHKQLTEFFHRSGLLHKFKRGDKVSFDKKVLKRNVDLHPSIALLRAARRASDFLGDKILSPDFLGKDGRVHADCRQLGTETGRQTSRWPNILGLDGVLRPLVVPEERYGIGEIDWSQVEVGVAAAVYGDDELVRMFNSGDVYSAMAQHFFREDVPFEDLSISGREFKCKHKTLRNQMKSCTLGIIYGMTPIGLAQTLGTTKTKAEALQKRFMYMFPQLQESLALSAQWGAIRGNAFAISGLKRYRAKSGSPTSWEKNWLINFPVQGGAAVVFKAAGNRLDKLYRQYEAKIIIPLHDSFVFEAPLDELETVAELTARVMCDTLQEYFPMLQPQVEVNISRPDCWNKDGDTEALNRWIESLNDLMGGQ